MAENSKKREWKGIRQNECTFQGKVIEDPSIHPTQNGRCAFIKLVTDALEQAPSGQFVEQEIIVPLIVMDNGKVDKVVEPYIQKGRELLVKGYYKAWTTDDNSNHHGIVVTVIKLGTKPFVPKDKDRQLSVPLPP